MVLAHRCRSRSRGLGSGQSARGTGRRQRPGSRRHDRRSGRRRPYRQPAQRRGHLRPLPDQQAGPPALRPGPGRGQAPRPVRTIKNPGCPQRAVEGRAGTGDRPGRRRCAAGVLRWQRRGPAGPVPRACRARHGFVSRSASAATASPPAAQAGNHIDDVTPAHRVRRQPGHGGHGLRHQPDRTAMEITMDCIVEREVVNVESLHWPQPGSAPW
jgi:hypothetical protein